MFPTMFLFSIPFCCLRFCPEIRFCAERPSVPQALDTIFMRTADIVPFNPIEPGDLKK